MATDKQVNYAMSLMRQLGYGIVWMNSEHKSLGATMRERQGKVENWLKNKSVAEMSGFIEDLKKSLVKFVFIAGKIYYTTSLDNEIKDSAIELQKFLKNVGAYKGKIDGIPGPKTSEASYEVLGFYLLNDPRRY